MWEFWKAFDWSIGNDIWNSGKILRGLRLASNREREKLRIRVKNRWMQKDFSEFQIKLKEPTLAYK